MRIQTEELVILGAIWAIVSAVAQKNINGISLLGFFPPLLRCLSEEIGGIWNE